MRSAFAVFLLFATVSSAQTGPGSKHPFTAHDWAILHSARAAAVSPDGKDILYQVSFGGEKGPTNHEWHLIHPDGTDPRKLELSQDFHPAGFTPDGHALYGTYKINDLMQFAVFPVESLKARLTPSVAVLLPAGVQSVVASPDGSRYSILADPRTPEPPSKVHTVVEPQQTSLYVVNADGTGGKWWCQDLKNIADGAIAWSPDSTSLAVGSQTPKIGFHYVHSFIDVCSASGSRRVAELSNSTTGIAFVNGGKDIAFLSTTTSVLTPDHLWTVPVSGGEPKDVTPKLEGSAESIAADAHGNVWVLVNRGVQNEIDSFRDNELNLAYRWPDGITQGLPIFSEYVSAAPQLAFTVADPQHSANVAAPQADGLHKITHEGDDDIAKIDLGTVRRVHWTSKQGIPLEGIVTFPAAYQEGRKYPFLVLPHGGPEANDLLGLDPFARTIAGFGYVVLQPEYRGSTGYGTEFLDAIYQHFGDRAFQDVDSATDYAIAQGWADPNRLAIFGWSAGGFMTSWTVTQTGRYRAAIEGAGITDWGSFMWTSDVQQIDYDQRWPARDPEAFRKFSAVDFADKVTTPLLIEHGDADRRVPTYQGQEFYEALAAQGKTVRFVTYPGSPHFPVLWEQRLDVFREIEAWLKKYNP
ncbi:MAG: S9 family peptidase [Acidobacteriaceae bacterium]|nr:S9 family peptidase [Acidobacteriaceae bacterium]